MDTGSQDDATTFVARLTSPAAALFEIFFPLLLLFGGAPALMLHPFMRERFGYDLSPPLLMTAGLFGFFLAIVLVEFLLTAARLASGAAALRISETGVAGLHAHAVRRFAWDEINKIYRRGDRLIITRKPQSLFERATHLVGAPGDRHRHEVAIMVHLNQVDHSVEAIVAALQRFAPQGSPFADPDWRPGTRTTYFYRER